MGRAKTTPVKQAAARSDRNDKKEDTFLGTLGALQAEYRKKSVDVASSSGSSDDTDDNLKTVSRLLRIKPKIVTPQKADLCDTDDDDEE